MRDWQNRHPRLTAMRLSVKRLSVKVVLEPEQSVGREVWVPLAHAGDLAVAYHLQVWRQRVE